MEVGAVVPFQINGSYRNCKHENQTCLQEEIFQFWFRHYKSDVQIGTPPLNNNQILTNKTIWTSIMKQGPQIVVPNDSLINENFSEKVFHDLLTNTDIKIVPCRNSYLHYLFVV